MVIEYSDVGEEGVFLEGDFGAMELQCLFITNLYEPCD
jgi:hypothetical protein